MGELMSLEDLAESLESWMRPWCFKTVGVTALSSSLLIFPLTPGVGELITAGFSLI